MGALANIYCLFFANELALFLSSVASASAAFSWAFFSVDVVISDFARKLPSHARRVEGELVERR